MSKRNGTRIHDEQKKEANERRVGMHNNDNKSNDNKQRNSSFNAPFRSAASLLPLKRRRNTKYDIEKEKEKEKETTSEIAGVDSKLVEQIMQELLVNAPAVHWSDISGLNSAKRCVQEAVIWPMQRPELFTGLRSPPRGILLFGPPGTGKTMIGRAIASESGASFFNISASSLLSKWFGEGEKMVRALFAVARNMQPSVVFIDEIDSLLSQRGDGEGDGSMRVKTEFLVQMDGMAASKQDRVLVVGATNRPEQLDEAARRRLVKRLYIALPDFEARVGMLKHVLRNEKHTVTEEQFTELGRLCNGYSGSDIYNLCAEAALGGVRELGGVVNVQVSEVRAVEYDDVVKGMKVVRKSVGGELGGYEQWNRMYGSFGNSNGNGNGSGNGNGNGNGNGTGNG